MPSTFKGNRLKKEKPRETTSGFFQGYIFALSDAAARHPEPTEPTSCGRIQMTGRILDASLRDRATKMCHARSRVPSLAAISRQLSKLPSLSNESLVGTQ